jgi:hypothetical protein
LSSSTPGPYGSRPEALLSFPHPPRYSTSDEFQISGKAIPRQPITYRTGRDSLDRGGAWARVTAAGDDGDEALMGWTLFWKAIKDAGRTKAHTQLKDGAAGNVMHYANRKEGARLREFTAQRKSGRL